MIISLESLQIRHFLIVYKPTVAHSKTFATLSGDIMGNLIRMILTGTNRSENALLSLMQLTANRAPETLEFTKEADKNFFLQIKNGLSHADDSKARAFLFDLHHVLFYKGIYHRIFTTSSRGFSGIVSIDTIATPLRVENVSKIAREKIMSQAMNMEHDCFIDALRRQNKTIL